MDYFKSVIYFSESQERAEVLSDLLYFEGIQLQLIGNPKSIPGILRRDRPRLVIYDHEQYREETLSLVSEARAAAGTDFLVIPVVKKEWITLQDIEKLHIDSTLDPHFDFEAIHCTVRRLLFSHYSRWKRREERLPLELDIDFSAVTRFGEIPLKPSNLNMTGAQLQLDPRESHPFQRDQLINLEALLPESTGRSEDPIPIKAITRWVSSHTLGVEFYEYNRSSLRSLIELTAKIQDDKAK